MNGNLYLWVNIAAIAVPFAFSWHPKIRFVDEWRRFWPACLLTLAFFIAWDVWFTAKGVWGFNEAYLTGVSLWGLPLEEWLFFITIPYACVFTYFVFRKHLKLQWSDRSKLIVVLIVVLSTVLCITNTGNWYTVSATGLSALFGLLLWKTNPDWLAHFILSFIILLIPFTLTNGILTGIEFWTADIITKDPSLILDQVVWYDNGQNLGVRFFTIPFEDFFYAFVLIGMNVYLFERRGRN